MSDRIKQILLTPPAAVLMGALCGLLARFAEYRDSFLEDVTSRVMLWVVVCVLVTLLSSSKRQAETFVAFFAVPMIAANLGLWYYLAHTTDYAPPTVVRLVCWIVFGLLSPLFASGVYMCRHHSLFSILMQPAILILPLLVTLIAFRSICIADILFAAVLAYLIYFKKLGQE